MIKKSNLLIRLDGQWRVDDGGGTKAGYVLVDEAKMPRHGRSPTENKHMLLRAH